MVEVGSYPQRDADRVALDSRSMAGTGKRVQFVCEREVMEMTVRDCDETARRSVMTASSPKEA